MSNSKRSDRAIKARRIKAVHARRPIRPDPRFELELSRHLASTMSPEQLQAELSAYGNGTGVVETLMRRALWRALCRAFGHSVVIEPQASALHMNTISIGDGVFLGHGSYIQGRHDGRCNIGDRVWIGPQCYFDARDLVIGDNVGIGPGVRILGSEHTGIPANRPLLATDLIIRTVIIGERADIGTGAVILPGVRIGKDAIIGAGAVVTGAIPARAIAAGVPAKVLRFRKSESKDRTGRA